eukprot:TRINITY_DN2364_c0_g1_i18.p1 TRINITY_DN2364_c0_g1~~TRINITY_DN2364_c0_g1_i18.p1  ORF type:complete len:353 (+),score=82.77 TRINITY_DN2364_c0_g1_i18:101-1159(+)
MIRRPPRSTLSSSSAASDVYKRQYQRRVREVAPTNMLHHHPTTVPAGMLPGEEALAYEADGAFERKHGYPPGEHEMAYPPLMPHFKQLKHGDISEEYQRHGIKPLSKRMTLKEWYKLTASQPSSRYSSPQYSARTSGGISCSGTPNLQPKQTAQIDGQPLGVLLLDNLSPQQLAQASRANFILSRLAELHPPALLHDKKAQCARLCELQDTISCCTSAATTRSSSKLSSRVSSVLNSLTNTPELRHSLSQIPPGIEPLCLQEGVRVSGRVEMVDGIYVLRDDELEEEVMTVTEMIRSLRPKVEDSELNTILVSIMGPDYEAGVPDVDELDMAVMSTMRDFDSFQAPKAWGTA